MHILHKDVLVLLIDDLIGIADEVLEKVVTALFNVERMKFRIV